MKKCWIMRGLPGSGKDHWIEDCRESILASAVGGMPIVCSADFFHYTKEGKYEYKKENAKKAHDWCLMVFARTVQAGQTPLVVNNTNIKMFEIAPYYRLAEAFGYEVEIVHILADPEVCKVRNVHGVPPETIDAMLRGLEAIPPWWKLRVVMN